MEEEFIYVKRGQKDYSMSFRLQIVSLGAVIKEKIEQGNKICDYTVGDFGHIHQ